MIIIMPGMYIENRPVMLLRTLYGYIITRTRTA